MRGSLSSMPVTRLNNTCKRSLESAAGLTVLRTHYNVESEHGIVTVTRSGGRPDPGQR
jgi:hypothetical protein